MSTHPAIAELEVCCRRCLHEFWTAADSQDTVECPLCGCDALLRTGEVRER